MAGLEKQGNKRDDYAVFLHYAYPPAVSARRQLYAERKNFGDQRQRITEIMVMKEMPGERETHLLNRGHYENRGEVVRRATPKVLPPFPVDAPKNRLGLAQWLTSDDHPLLARVTVNRYWQMIFGRGLVSTSEDFGMQGKPSTHPKLLDWLARDFIHSGWDLHQLLRKMVLSHTYRQSSKIQSATQESDPENLLLSRAPTYRLPAEMIGMAYWHKANFYIRKLEERVPSLMTLRFPSSRSIQMVHPMFIEEVCTPIGSGPVRHRS